MIYLYLHNIYFVTEKPANVKVSVYNLTRKVSSINCRGCAAFCHYVHLTRHKLGCILGNRCLRARVKSNYVNLVWNLSQVWPGQGTGCRVGVGLSTPWNNGKSGAKLDLTSSTTPGLQIHMVDHTRTANLCDWLPCRHAALLLVGCPHSLDYLHLPVVERLIFCISATPHLGTSFPLFHAFISLNFIE